MKQLKGLKPTARGRMLLDIAKTLGTAAVLIFCIGAGWAFLTVIAP